MKRFGVLAAAVLVVLGGAPSVSLAEKAKPNVLFLVVDDLRDWVGFLDGYGGKVQTPNLDALASRSTAFTNAHVPSPKCGPCRAAVMTGRMPSSTGIYDNDQWLEPYRPDITTLPRHFRGNGYRVLGAGKIFHHTAGFHPPRDWNEHRPNLFQADPWLRSSRLNYPWTTPAESPPGYPFSGHHGRAHELDWGDPGTAESEMDDTLAVDYAVSALQESHKTPFFLACGLFRPHIPWYVPQRYLDLYPVDEIVLPEVRDDDLKDLPKAALAMGGSGHRLEFQRIRDGGKWKQATAAYLASITYADAQIGRILEALAASEHADNTIIVLWSDHGYHLGEKGKWHKDTLWEVATRVPFCIHVPGQSAARCDEAVCVIDLFPTLVDLCDLSAAPELDGQSLILLLEDPKSLRKRPAVTEFGRGNAAVRDERWRYIRYADGSEELYDHANDPQEWTNLAPREEHREVTDHLAPFLPQQWAESAPKKRSYVFDPETYTWQSK